MMRPIRAFLLLLRVAWTTTFLSTCLHNVALAEATYDERISGLQFGLFEGNATAQVSAVVYDAAEQVVHLVGRFTTNEEDGGCWLAEVDLITMAVRRHERLDTPNVLEACDNLVLREPSRLWAVGHSEPGGLLRDLEVGGGLGTRDIYGMILDLEWTPAKESSTGEDLIAEDGLRYLAEITSANSTDGSGDVFVDANSTDLETNSTNDSDSNSTAENGHDLDGNGFETNSTEPLENNATGFDTNSTDGSGYNSTSDDASPEGPLDTNSADLEGNNTGSIGQNSTVDDSADDSLDTNSTEFDTNTTDGSGNSTVDDPTDEPWDTNTTGIDTNSTNGSGNSTFDDPWDTNSTAIDSNSTDESGNSTADEPTDDLRDTNSTDIDSNSTDGGGNSTVDEPTDDYWDTNSTDSNSTEPTNSTGTDETDDLSPLLLLGGRILGGSRIVYPFGLATDEEFVFTASLEGDPAPARNSSSSLKSVLLFNNLPFDFQFVLKVSAFPVLNETADDFDAVGQSLGPPVWESTLSPEGSGSIVAIAGILQLEESIIVGGTTNGIGNGLGVGNSSDDLDGFVTKFVKKTGRLYGSDEDTTGATSSFRIQSSVSGDDYVNGLCISKGDPSFVYVTGSSTGSLGEINATKKGHTRAFLMKLRVADLEPEWTVDLGATSPYGIASSPVTGISCALADDGNFIYFAGNVDNDGFIAESDVGRSAGGSDVFLAKVEASTGSLEFVRQIGSPEDDTVAPRGSLSVRSDGTAVLVGNTKGSLYRARGNISEDYDFFVAIITGNGTIPTQIPTPSLSPTPSPTLSPTADASSVPSQPPNTTLTVSPSLSPTRSPVMVPPATPLGEVQTYSFKNVTLFLDGGKPLTADSRRVFERTTESFYRSAYSDSLRRRLQVVGVSQFDTTVIATGETPDAAGNTIKYDQVVSFATTNGETDEEVAKDLLVAPFLISLSSRTYTEQLRSSNENFQSVTGVDRPIFPNPGSDADDEPDDDSGGGFDILLVAIIAGGVLGCCICGLAAWFLIRRRRSKEKPRDVEDPRYANSGRPSGEAGPSNTSKIYPASFGVDARASFGADARGPLTFHDSRINFDQPDRQIRPIGRNLSGSSFDEESQLERMSRSRSTLGLTEETRRFKDEDDSESDTSCSFLNEARPENIHNGSGRRGPRHSVPGEPSEMKESSSSLSDSDSEEGSSDSASDSESDSSRQNGNVEDFSSFNDEFDDEGFGENFGSNSGFPNCKLSTGSY